jgi:Holliday junction resolvasome RuvABC endonuclease subunit
LENTKDKDLYEMYDWQKEWVEMLESAKKNKKYLHAWDLSLKCPAVTIFDLGTFEPVCIQHYLVKGKHTHGKRLYELYQAALALQTTYPPTACAVERGFSRFNTETQVLYRVHGIFNMAYKDVPQFYYPPKTVKAALLDGDATKKQVQEAIKKHYSNIEFADGDPGEDESDSCAVGVTHMIQHYNMPWEKPEKVKKPRVKKKKEDK